MGYTNLIQGMVVDMITGALRDTAAAIEGGADPADALERTAYKLQLGWKFFKDGTHKQLSVEELREGKLIGEPIEKKGG